MGIDLWEDTDLRRFDHISLGSSVWFARVELAVEGREWSLIPLPFDAIIIQNTSILLLLLPTSCCYHIRISLNFFVDDPPLAFGAKLSCP